MRTTVRRGRLRINYTTVYSLRFEVFVKQNFFLITKRKEKSKNDGKRDLSACGVDVADGDA